MFITFEFIYCTLMLNFTIDLFSLPELLDFLLSILEKVKWWSIWSEIKGYIDESPHLRCVAPFISIILAELFLIIDQFYEKRWEGRGLKNMFMLVNLCFTCWCMYFASHIFTKFLSTIYGENGKLLEDADNNFFFICINLIQKVISSSW